jgi:superfamily II DNA or RNA helicase
MKFNPIHVLGLSATPEGSTAIIGEILDNIHVDEARVCPFTIHLVTYKPTKEEMESYNLVDAKMKEVAIACGAPADKPYLMPKVSDEYDALALKRRQVSYTFKSRIPLTVQIAKFHLGERTVIFTERTWHAHAIEKAFIKEGIPCSMYVKDKDTFKDFETGKTNVLVMVKSLREAWDDPTLSVCIMASLSTRPIIMTQTMGRTMRVDPDRPDKHAHNYLLLADGTSDFRVRGSLDYPKNRFKNDTPETLFGSKTLEEYT